MHLTFGQDAAMEGELDMVEARHTKMLCKLTNGGDKHGDKHLQQNDRNMPIDLCRNGQQPKKLTWDAKGLTDVKEEEPLLEEGTLIAEAVCFLFLLLWLLPPWEERKKWEDITPMLSSDPPQKIVGWHMTCHWKAMISASNWWAVGTKHNTRHVIARRPLWTTRELLLPECTLLYGWIWDIERLPIFDIFSISQPEKIEGWRWRWRATTACGGNHHSPGGREIIENMNQVVNNWQFHALETRGSWWPWHFVQHGAPPKKTVADELPRPKEAAEAEALEAEAASKIFEHLLF